MLSPLKLSVMVCGAAVGLAVAPYFVNKVLPPGASETVAQESPASEPALAAPVADSSVAMVDLPIAAPAAPVAPTSVPSIEPIRPAVVVAEAHPVAAVVATPAELQLPVSALPSPAPATPAADLTLPSLQGKEIASAAMPTPAPSPVKTPAPTPAPTPVIPYRSEVEAAQKLMKELGFETGKIDGKLGKNTEAAVREFQKKHALPVNGDVDSALISEMEKAVAALPTPAPESKIQVTDAKADAETTSADDPDVVIVRKEPAIASAEAKAKAEPAAKPKVDPGPVPTLQNMKDVRKIQEQLKLAGSYDGDVDGKWGDLTRAAMRDFQEKAGVEVTGKPNTETWLAMHSGSFQTDTKTVKEAKIETAKAAKPVKRSDELKISSAESVPSEEAPLVVNVNGDGVSDPDAVKPMATPRSVSALDENPEKSSEAASKKEEARVKVSTPERESAKKASSASDVAGSVPTDLAVAAEDKDQQKEKLRKELENRRAEIKTVGSDYDVKKYAPKSLETVNNMMDDFKIETVSNNPVEAREKLAKIDKEIERAKSESIKKKASETVDGVRKSYEALKKSFPNRIKALSLKDKEQKSQREELTELVAKVDLGFEAMEKDYKKGNFDPIFENGKDFKNTIDEINRTVAGVYLEARLDEKETKSKLSKSTLKSIEELQKSEDNLEAADKLDAALESKSSNKKS